jgi:RHS repeat-associated protein
MVFGTERGQLIAEYKNSTTLFVHDNNIGTSTILSSVAGAVADCNALFPFGEQDNTICSTSNLTTHKFTGKERDTESNLDNFGARYYSSAMGRFLTADWSAIPAPVPYANLSDPQTLNLYAYVGNNPLGTADLDGHDWDKFRQDLRSALSQTTAKATIGIGLAVKGTIAGVKVRAEVAAKANLQDTGNKTSLSLSAEGGVSGGKAKPVGLAGSIDKVVGSYDSDRNALGGAEPATREWVYGAKSGNSEGTVSIKGDIALGAEVGETAVGGGEIKITPEGMNDWKQVWGDLKGMLSIPPPPPTPPPPAAPPNK